MAKNRSRRIVKALPIRNSIFILGCITFLVAIWYSLPRPKQSGIFEIVAPSGTVMLTLGAPSPTLEVASSSALTLAYNSTSHLNTAQVELSYDPTFINIQSVNKDPSFTNTVSPPDQTSPGIIKFTYSTASDSAGLTGSGTIATLDFNTLKTGSTSVNFTENTFITTVEEGAVNALQSVASPTLTIIDHVIEQSATPSASHSLASSTPASPERPAKPTGLRSNCYEGGSKVTLRWDSVSGASSYKLRLDQKDGSDDKSIDNIGKTEHDLSVIPDQKYSWWVHATYDGVDSDEAKIDELVCAKSTASTATPTPSPSQVASATPTPSKKPLTQKVTEFFKKSPTPTPKVSPTPKPSSSPSTITVNPSPVGGLNDIFGSPVASPKSSSTNEPGIFRKIVLGWQAFFVRLSELF